MVHRLIVVLLAEALFASIVHAQCTASITMEPSGTGGIHAVLSGAGGCRVYDPNGGPIVIRLSKNNGPFEEVTNCPGPCSANVDEGDACAPLQNWRVGVSCLSQTGASTCVNDSAFGNAALQLSHANSLTPGEAADSVIGTLHVHAPDAWTDRAISYRILLPDGNAQDGGSVAVGGTFDDLDVSFHAPLPANASLTATLESCSDTYSPVIIDGGNDCKCDLNQPPECQDCTGGPIRLSRGSMRYSEIDPLPSVGGVPMKRTYDSVPPSLSWFGTGWSSIFDRALYLYPPQIDGDYAMIWLDGAKRYIFRGRSGVFTQLWPLGSQRATLTVDPTTGAYTLHEPMHDVDVVIEPATGLPVQYRALASGRSLNISYSGTTPTHVSDSWGNFAWTISTSGHRIDAISIDGTTLNWQYAYTGTNLTTVSGPGGGAWRSYAYSGSLLTDIRDAAGRLIESHTYDSSGRAISSLQSEGDISSIEYTAVPNSFERIAKVHMATGAETDYHIRYSGGRARTMQIDGNCSSCGTNDAVFAFRAGTYGVYGGELLRMQDARGYITEWTYDGQDRVISVIKGYKPASCDPETDVTRCRQTSDALQTLPLTLTTSAERIEYDYFDNQDASWPDRPSRVRRRGLVDTRFDVSETLSYDAATGVVVADRMSGYTSGSRYEEHLTTTALYANGEPAAFDPGGAFSSAWLTVPQPAGLRKQVDGPRTEVADLTQWVYYPIDSAVPAAWRGHPAAVRDPAGNTTRYENYDVFGNARRVVDPNGVANEYTYDAIGRPLTSTIKGVSGCDTAADPLCATDLVTARIYQSDFGPLASETRPGGGASTYEYEARGRVSAMTRTVSGSLSERVEYDYDAATGHKLAERYFSGQPGSWTLARSEAYRYDLFGRLMAIDHPDGKSILYSYDGTNNVRAVQDENHLAPNTIYSYDPVGRIAAVAQTLGGGSIATQYGYDAHGNLTSVTDPNGNVTAYAFDDFDRLMRQVSPVTGTTTYRYDFAGNLITAVDANGATTSRAYDALNRPASAVSTRGADSETVTWTYDGAAPFGRGRLASMTDPTGSTSFAYEHRGLLHSESRSILGALYTTTFGYDADGNRASLAYPSGRSVAYGFDLASRPTSATSGGTTWVSSAAYLPFGPPTQIAFGNGTTKTMRYDSRYRVLENKLTGPSGTIADYNYAEDAAGNITQIHDALDPSYNRDFGYDDLNRLISAATGSSLWGTGAYAYDSMGNMLSRSLGTPPADGGQILSLPRRRPKGSAVSGYVETTLFAYQGTTPLLATVTASGLDHTVAYDAAGNEAQYYVARAYSPRNLLASVTDTSGEGPAHRIDYGYDGRGVRVTRTEIPNDPGPALRAYIYTPELQLLAVTVDNPANIWAAGLPRIMSAPLAPNREIVWFAGQPVGEIGPPRTADSGILAFGRRPTTLAATDTFYTFTDHLGTPLLQTNTAAQIVWRAEYEPYGNVWTMRAGAAADQPLRFPGQEVAMRWEGTEENYNIFRWYGSGSGRFIQPDPIGMTGGPNLFEYVDDNPTNLVDPLGLIRPVKRKDQKTRPCNSEEEARCRASCKYGMESCRVSRTFRVYRSLDGKIGRGWMDGPMSCSCKEPDCLDKLKELMRKFFDHIPDQPLIPVLPLVPPPTLVPEPVIPGLPPIILNPCLMGPQYCGDRRVGVA